jgi:hypothetical protein
MPTRYFRNHRARHKRLFNDQGFEILREMPPPARPGYHFQPANLRRLRLKRMVKLRHKPISKSEISTIPHRQSQWKVGSPQRLQPICAMCWPRSSPGIRGAASTSCCRSPTGRQQRRQRPDNTAYVVAQACLFSFCMARYGRVSITKTLLGGTALCSIRRLARKGVFPCQLPMGLWA